MAAKVKPVVEGQRTRLHTLQIDNAFEHLLRLAEHGATPQTGGTKTNSKTNTKTRGTNISGAISVAARGRSRGPASAAPRLPEPALPGGRKPSEKGEERLLRVWGALQETLRPLVGPVSGAGPSATTRQQVPGSPTGTGSEGSLSFGTTLAAKKEDEAPWRIATTLWQWQQASAQTPQSAGSAASVQQVRDACCFAIPVVYDNANTGGVGGEGKDGGVAG